MSLSMSLDDQDSDFYSELDSTVATPSRRARASSLSRASDFTADADDDHHGGQGGSSLATLTSFDTYFLHASRPAHTSSNVFSQLVQPLSPDEYAASLSRSFYTHPFPIPSSTPTSTQSQTGQPVEGETDHHRAHMPRYLLELEEGFNLLFYGYGSKRRALNDLARACAHTTRAYPSYYAHVLVLNGFLPSFSARDIFAALARLPGAPQSVEDVAQFLTAEPVTAASPSPSPPASTTPSSSSSSSAPSTLVQKPRRQRQRRRRRLVLVVHNIDSPAVRSPKVRALLNALVSLRGVQIAASVDHINAPMIWTSTELLSRRWLWHDLTTLAAYDVELAGADPASLRGGAPTTAAATAATASMRAGGGGLAESIMSMGGGGGGVMMTETAARHVLVAVTQRARTLFMLMGRRQLDAIADNAGGGGGGGVGVVEPTTPAGAVEVAVPYDTLFNLARDNFVATNDTALRALLGEFRDHGLVVTVGTGAMGSGEMLWIPLRKERLTKLLDGLAE
jgi:origin recognition complex subunit 2